MLALLYGQHLFTILKMLYLNQPEKAKSKQANLDGH